jgi:uncharacterized protein YjeT (DUF2065 family)
MELTLLLGKVFGLFFLIGGLGFLLNQKYYRQMLDGLLKNQALMYFWAMAGLVVGLFLVFTHNEWEAGALATIVTLIGWAALLKGTLLFLFPGKADQVLMAWRRKPNGAMIEGILALIVGVVISYLAFLA